jgi:hypothetical protein
LQFQAIKQYIHQNRADAINPQNFLNIWIIDMMETTILGFTSFPWEPIDAYHGIVMNRRAFFPEDYGEVRFNLYKTFTHAIGHYFGLLHVFSHHSGLGAYAAINLNADNEIGNFTGDYIADTPNQFKPTFDPTDKIYNQQLNMNPQYNPLFMDFMDYTYDRYVAIFTNNQIQKMRYMIFTYLPNINSNIAGAILPIPKYNPNTDTMIGLPVNLNGASLDVNNIAMSLSNITANLNNISTSLNTQTNLLNTNSQTNSTINIQRSAPVLTPTNSTTMNNITNNIPVNNIMSNAQMRDDVINFQMNNHLTNPELGTTPVNFIVNGIPVNSIKMSGSMGSNISVGMPMNMSSNTILNGDELIYSSITNNGTTANSTTDTTTTSPAMNLVINPEMNAPLDPSINPSQAIRRNNLTTGLSYPTNYNVNASIGNLESDGNISLVNESIRPRFTKYGQLIPPIEEQNIMGIPENISISVATQRRNLNRPPRKRFIRTKPIGLQY